MTKKKKIKIDVYQQLTDKIVSKLEQGEIPWKKPWKSVQFGYPQNFISKKIYKGSNFFQAMFEDRATPYWLTYKQAKDLGGQVKKGEKGVPIVYFSFIEKEIEGKEIRYPMIQKSTVFNLEQIEGVENPFEEEKKKFEEENLTVFNPIESCDELLSTFVNKVAPYSHNNGQRAFYRPGADTITMPNKEFFHKPEGYYCTLFHEMAHSTGHSDRLDRNGIIGHHKFGSKGYAREELVAELTSAFLCSKAGIENDVVDNNAAYISNWLGALKNDKMIVYDAMKDAFKAIEYLGILNEAA
jgi:antirestriction protein ArdC|tara:strand:- start:85 stop:975 length:891 start_codon:yes stop_codon:yes gene_type:complete